MTIEYELSTDHILTHYKDHIQHQKAYKSVLHHLSIYYIAEYYHDLGDMNGLSMTTSSAEEIIYTLNECTCCERHQTNRPTCLYADKKTYLYMGSLDDSYTRVMNDRSIVKTKTSTPHIIPHKHVHCNCLCRKTSRDFVRNFNPNSYYEQERLWIIDTIYSQIKYIQLNLKRYYQYTLQYTNRLSGFIRTIQVILDDIISDITTNNIEHISYQHIEPHVEFLMMESFQRSMNKILNNTHNIIEHIHCQWSDILDLHKKYIEHRFDHTYISFPQDDELQIVYKNIEDSLINTMERTMPYFGEEYPSSIKSFFTTLDTICEKKHFFYRSLYIYVFEQCASSIHKIRDEITKIKELQFNSYVDMNDSSCVSSYDSSSDSI